MPEEPQSGTAATSTPDAETREHPKPPEEPVETDAVSVEVDQPEPEPEVLIARGATPQELLTSVANLLGYRFVIAAPTWHELIAEAGRVGPSGKLASPIQAKLSNAAAVARGAGL